MLKSRDISLGNILLLDGHLPASNLQEDAHHYVVYGDVCTYPQLPIYSFYTYRTIIYQSKGESSALFCFFYAGFFVSGRKKEGCSKRLVD